MRVYFTKSCTQQVVFICGSGAKALESTQFRARRTTADARKNHRRPQDQSQVKRCLENAYTPSKI